MRSRARPKMAGKPVSWRVAGRATRKQWADYRRLASLTLSEIRSHAADGFRNLPGDDPAQEVRAKLADLLTTDRPAPEDARFWEAARDREFVGPRLAALAATGEIDDAVYAAWTDAAAALYAAHMLFVEHAQYTIEQWSSRAESVWHRGHAICSAHGDEPRWEEDHSCGLAVQVCRDGFEEPWTRAALLKLQWAQVNGTPSERQKGTNSLRYVGEMMGRVGQGGKLKFEPEVAKKRRTISTNASKMVGRVLAYTDREMAVLDRSRFTREDVAVRELRRRLEGRPQEFRAHAEQLLSRHLKGRRQK